MSAQNTLHNGIGRIDRRFGKRRVVLCKKTVKKRAQDFELRLVERILLVMDTEILVFRARRRKIPFVEQNQRK